MISNVKNHLRKLYCVTNKTKNESIRFSFKLFRMNIYFKHRTELKNKTSSVDDLFYAFILTNSKIPF